MRDMNKGQQLSELFNCDLKGLLLVVDDCTF